MHYAQFNALNVWIIILSTHTFYLLHWIYIVLKYYTYISLQVFYSQHLYITSSTGQSRLCYILFKLIICHGSYVGMAPLIFHTSQHSELHMPDTNFAECSSCYIAINPKENYLFHIPIRTFRNMSYITIILNWYILCQTLDGREVENLIKLYYHISNIIQFLCNLSHLFTLFKLRLFVDAHFPLEKSTSPGNTGFEKSLNSVILFAIK